ncbi:MAG: hypothetical protein IPK52_26165 [Chloroflexi bacterium]|nr:hypothetical protein [Chloroflexota bacterium]
MTAGRTLRVKAAGFYSTDASSAGTLQFRVKLGSIPIVASATFSATDGVSNGAWSLDADITCRTVGGSGTVFGQGYVRLWDGAAVAIAHQMIATSTSTIDTTASQAVGLTAQWGTADTDNTLTITNLLIEAV